MIPCPRIRVEWNVVCKQNEFYGQLSCIIPPPPCSIYHPPFRAQVSGWSLYASSWLGLWSRMSSKKGSWATYLPYSVTTETHTQLNSAVTTLDMDCPQSQHSPRVDGQWTKRLNLYISRRVLFDFKVVVFLFHLSISDVFLATVC